jgi:copper homeostasis protein CutC
MSCSGKRETKHVADRGLIVDDQDRAHDACRSGAARVELSSSMSRMSGMEYSSCNHTRARNAATNGSRRKSVAG